MKTNKFQSIKFYMLALASGFFIMMSSCTADQITTQDEEMSKGETTNAQTRAANGPSANGHGTLTFDGIPIEGEKFRHFTFHAREKNDGSVEGSGVLTYAGGVRNLSFDIDCLNVIGNIAIMSGVTTRDNQFPENEGLLVWFKVVDNGEGKKADPDRMTLFFSGTDPGVFDCAIHYTNPTYEIEGGNVQVKE